MGKRWNGEMVRKFVEDEGYQLIEVPNEDWVKKLDRIVVSCGEHEFMMCWNYFQQGSRCPKCSGNYKYSHEEICEEVSKLDENYFVCNDSLLYKNAFTKLKLSCGEHEFMMCWNNFRKGRRCPKCSGKYRYSHDEICEEIKKMDSSYFVCNDSLLYKNAKTKLKLYHSVCENEFDVTWNELRNGERPCGCYTYSKTEILLREYFKSKIIEFSEQVTFDDLVSDKERKLRYDFGIYENDELLFLIEYDGIQHHSPQRFGGISQEQAEENFIKTQHHDKLKNDYAKENNIPLLRIRYDEDTIFVLENYLKDLQLIKEDDIINLTKEEE